MYNRYISQPDGSFRKNRMADPAPQQRPAAASREPEPQPSPPSLPFEPPRKNNVSHQSIGSFLKQLLPKGFDTGDLLIVLLLILMAGDCEEDQNTALLTLVLYLFL